MADGTLKSLRYAALSTAARKCSFLRKATKRSVRATDKPYARARA
jgi:hypothetical protein